MEKHTTSLDISRQLKEAGWKKETEFWWYVSSLGGKPNLVPKSNLSVNKKLVKLYSAPLATEILEELPMGLHIIKGISYIDGKFQVFTIDEEQSEPDESLPNALAKMWLYLKKEGLLK
jgi:hypothetical protein